MSEREELAVYVCKACDGKTLNLARMKVHCEVAEDELAEPMVAHSPEGYVLRVYVPKAPAPERVGGE